MRLSICFEFEPVVFITDNRMALPIVAFARCPGPNTLVPPCNFIVEAIGPVTTVNIPAPIVLEVIA